MLVDADSQPVLQPGQRTVWDINGQYNRDVKVTDCLIGYFD